MKNSFKIDGTEFGTETVSVKLSAEKTLIKELIIQGNKALCKELSNNEKGKWSWIIYPPKIYFKDIPCEEENGEITLDIDDDMLDEYDIALYLVEHNDFFGQVIISKNTISIKGITYLSGKEKELVIHVSY